MTFRVLFLLHPSSGWFTYVNKVWYDILLLQLCVQPVAVVGRLVQKQERDNIKGATVHKKYKKQAIMIYPTA